MGRPPKGLVAGKSLAEEYDPTDLDAYVAKMSQLREEWDETTTPAEKTAAIRRGFELYKKEVLPHLPKKN